MGCGSWRQLQTRLFPRVFPTDRFMREFTTPFPSFSVCTCSLCTSRLENFHEKSWKFDCELLWTQPEKQTGFHCRKNQLWSLRSLFLIFISKFLHFLSFPFLHVSFWKAEQNPTLNTHSFTGVLATFLEKRCINTRN